MKGPGPGITREISRILMGALRSSGELRLRRRIATFLRAASGALRDPLAGEARALLHDLGERDPRPPGGRPI